MAFFTKQKISKSAFGETNTVSDEAYIGGATTDFAGTVTWYEDL